MKVVVPIKQILDPTGFVVNRRRERIFVNREDYIINPNDKNALEAALQLKDADESVEVIAVSLGLARADDALREALAMGADAAYLLSDDTLAGVDARGAALALAAAVRKIGDVALVVTGSVALDTGGGQMAPRLAEALGLCVEKVEQTTDPNGKGPAANRVSIHGRVHVAARADAGMQYTVESVRSRTSRNRPPGPFTTATMQPVSYTHLTLPTKA